MDNLTNVCEATSQSHDIDNYRPTHRKGKKLLAEKKRRARINNCLMQIRDLVCEGEEDKDTDLDKMEKAEILEKTLEVLTRLRHDYSSSTSGNTFSARKAMAVRYASGFSSCAEESIRYIQSSRLVPTEVKVQLQNHLRAIARRMETVVQVDDQNVNFGSNFPTSSVSSSSYLSTEKYTAEEAEQISGSHCETTEARGVYVPSPINSSTPALQYNITHSTTAPISQQCDRVTSTPDAYPKVERLNHYQRSADQDSLIITETSEGSRDLKCRQRNEVHSSAVHKYEAVTPEFPREHFVSPYAPLATDQSYPSSVLSMSAYTPSVSSPIIMHPAALLNTNTVTPDTPIYCYRGYEPYPAISSALVRPVHYISTPISSAPILSTPVTKRTSTENSALNLCVKGNEAHQISPETMWRPW
ncbi:unnamed protein product [Lymnaea stagnalis]|uniref:Uncharacterized protein n=1 Tax=Lymnaea stagnalis TaxID=6523 RepID=A0AAV2IN00_LYMST